MELNDHYKRYDYNLKPFEYPIKRDPVLQAKFFDRMKGQFNIPGSLKPDFVAALVSKDASKVLEIFYFGKCVTSGK